MAHLSNPSLSPTEPFQTLPLELIDVVFDHLKDDITSRTRLASLLWVSRSFANPVKRRLFRHLKITYFHYDSTQPLCLLLYAILQGDPIILDYVRKVELLFDKENSYFDSSDGNWDGKSPNPVRSNELIEMLHMLSKAQVEELELYGKDIKGHTWPSWYGPRATAAIYALRCNPHLRKLSFHHLREIPGFMITGMPSTDRVEEFSTNHAVYIFCAVECSCQNCPRPYKSSWEDDDEDGANCLKLNPLVQQFVEERNIRPFSRLKTLYLPRKSEFPWTLCFPVVGSETMQQGRRLCLGYDTEDGLEREYGNTEDDGVMVPRLGAFEFSSLEELIIGNKGVATTMRRYADNYEPVIDILDRVGPNFRLLELRDRFCKGTHDLPTFPLNGIFDWGKISIFRISTVHDPSGRPWDDLAPSLAYDEVDSIATFLSNNAPLPGVKEISLSLMWPVWEVTTLFEPGHTEGLHPWECLCDVIKQSAIQKFDVSIRVRRIRKMGLGMSSKFAVGQLDQVRARWMEAMDFGKDIMAELKFQADNDEWDLEARDSDVWY